MAANKIKVKRGLKTNLPTLDEGEYALCTDTREIYMGTSTGNQKIITEEILLEMGFVQVEVKEAVDSSTTFTTTELANGKIGLLVVPEV